MIYTRAIIDVSLNNSMNHCEFYCYIFFGFLQSFVSIEISLLSSIFYISNYFYCARQQSSESLIFFEDGCYHHFFFFFEALGILLFFQCIEITDSISSFLIASLNPCSILQWCCSCYLLFFLWIPFSVKSIIHL